MSEQELLTALNTTMPFGKYKGRKLIDLPEPYLVWFHSKGFPNNKLGCRDRSRRSCGIHSIHGDTQLALMYEIKLNGLENMVKKR